MRFSSADVAIYVIMVVMEFQHSIIIVNNSVKIAMWTAHLKVSCVLWLAETKSVKLVQHQFRREYNLQRHDPVPDYKRIMAWDEKLKLVVKQW